MNISNATIGLLSRTSAIRLQTELLRAQQELASGRHSDIGLTLGARFVVATALRNEIADTGVFLETNQIASARFAAARSALDSLTNLAQTVQQNLLGASSGIQDASVIAHEAQMALNQTISIGNSTFDGAYLFAGLSSGAKPLNEFIAGSNEGSASVLSQTFLSKFGVAAGSVESAGIDPSQMQSFLDIEFTQLFDDTNWPAIWANASEDGGETRISDTLSVRNAVTANAPAVRDLVKSLAMVAGLGIETLNDDARQTVLSEAAQTIGRALEGISGLNAELGIASKSIGEASDELNVRNAQLQVRLSDIESVDPIEISSRLAALSTQLQASYQVTAKLAVLSLINFI